MSLAYDAFSRHVKTRHYGNSTAIGDAISDVDMSRATASDQGSPSMEEIDEEMEEEEEEENSSDEEEDEEELSEEQVQQYRDYVLQSK